MCDALLAAVMLAGLLPAVWLIRQAGRPPDAA
jgi:hypothetical protein